VLGIALVALGEDLGASMASRALEHVLQYGDAAQRKAVPLALALLSASNPTLTVTDSLGRLAHDPNEAVASAAVLALGLAAAGTNNARVAGQLRQLSSYYYKEPSLLYLVRVAQGLVHAGKGLLSLHPLHADRALLHLPALASLACVAFCGLDMGETLTGKHACLLYLLTPALRPRMLLTVDGEGKPLATPVRVGEALDTVAQAGRPKSITGFQTHTTPVLLAVGDRAELATEQYVPASPLLEGVVILTPNPEWVAAKN
jgi:26S proteasome regulatory subunit N1